MKHCRLQLFTIFCCLINSICSNLCHIITPPFGASQLHIFNTYATIIITEHVYTVKAEIKNYNKKSNYCNFYDYKRLLKYNNSIKTGLNILRYAQSMQKRYFYNYSLLFFVGTKNTICITMNMKGLCHSLNDIANLHDP